MPLILLLVKSLPSMSYKFFNHLKNVFGTLLFQPSQMLTWMTFISFDALFFVDGIQCIKNISHKVGEIWHCGKCDGKFLECVFRYILKVDLEDITRYLHGVITLIMLQTNSWEFLQKTYVCS